jgi:hypothetical protein
LAYQGVEEENLDKKITWSSRLGVDAAGQPPARQKNIAQKPKYTIISQIITLLHVSTLSCHPQGACNQYLAKLHRYLKCGCW